MAGKRTHQPGQDRSLRHEREGEEQMGRPPVSLPRSGVVAGFQVLWGLMAPVFLGNAIGGTVLFGVLSYAQAMKEI